MQYASLTDAEGGLALDTPYNAALVAGIKSLPYSDRTWDAARRRWIIAYERAPEICRLVEQHLGVRLAIPQVDSVAASEMRVLRVEYIGRCKARQPDDPVNLWTASGYLSPSDRTLIFPEPVLRAWFLDDGTPAAEKQPRTPAGPQTLYQILTVKQSATDDELKRAYRRLAMQLHPDRNKEADATESFQRLQRAYEVLRDTKTRRKYDAGLTLEASMTRSRPKNFEVHRHNDDAYGYRSPLRAGFLVLEGTAHVGQFVVSKILKWDDIVDSQGRTLVSSWGVGDDMYKARWF